MPDTIKLPGVGPVKKPVLIAGVAVTAGILAYAYYRRSQAGADVAAPAAAVAPTDPGFVEDSTAGGYNTVSNPTAFSPFGYDLYGNPLPPPTGAGSGGPLTTNSDWASAAESALEDGNVSLEVSTLAISRVLGGLSVTSAQRDLFMQAIGLLGQPPQGYPTPIKLTDTPAQPAPSTTPPKGSSLPAPTGLHVVGSTSTHVTLAWNKVTGAVGYRLYRSDVSVNVGASTDTKADVGGLAHNHSYKFHVRAVGADGTYGAASASVTGKTKK